MSRKIPQARDEWIAYGNKMARAKKRTIPVVDISLNEIDKMWDCEYQAKKLNSFGKLVQVMASNSLNKLKKEIRNRKWGLAFLTTSKGSLSSGQYTVPELVYIPRY